MALIHLLLMFSVIFISHLSSNTVSSDTIQPTAITVQKGDSVNLTIQTPANEIPQFDDLDWLKDGSDFVVSYDFNRVKIHSSYKDRVYFNTGNYSLTLKNIQETDSGLYAARASGKSVTIIGQYNVTVVSSDTTQPTAITVQKGHSVHLCEQNVYIKESAYISDTRSHGTTRSVYLTWIIFLVLFNAII